MNIALAFTQRLQKETDYCQFFNIKLISQNANLVISRFRPLDSVKVFLCATMWHETYDEMMKIIISIFR